MSAETTLVLSLLANVVTIIALMRVIRAQKNKIYQDIGIVADNTTRLANAFITYVKRTSK